jgi:anti-sigma factor RsiW
MNLCESQAVRILLYIEGQLMGQEVEELSAHLKICDGCAARVQEEQDLTRLLRQSRPLYIAPEALRIRVTGLLETPAAAPRKRQHRYRRLVVRPWRGAGRQFLRTAALVFLILAGSLALAPHFVREAQAKDYVRAAASVHRSYLNGEIPLGIRSNSAAAVTSWVVAKVPFPFQLPASPAALQGKPEYRIAGASTVKYRGTNAVLVTYERDKQHISLLVAASEAAVVAGGEEVRYDRLVFHYRSQAGLRVITWTNHGLSYALVSTLSGSAKEPCMVCHQNMTDRDAFRWRP